MDFTFETSYKNFNSVFHDGEIDLSNIDFFSPWGIGLVCLKAVENMDRADKALKLPRKSDTLTYIKRMHFAVIMQELTYAPFLDKLNGLEIQEHDNPNVHEIMHCSFRDEFAARLESKIRLIFKAFGLNDNDEQKATALVGELGNNVFDHNAGSWPTNVVGAIIIAQNYPNLKCVEVVVADTGIGFLNSLKVAKPDLKNDIEAIKLGLAGVTGRVGEKRGNGLRTIQDWTINQFRGIV